jgi:hypothetical protein
LAEALKRDEASRTGIYFLIGDDPEQPTKQRVYVGEGDSVVDRIRSHAKDASKDFWTRVCLVTSKDMNLTKAHVRYLESRLVELTKDADRGNVANGNEPSRKSLPESDIADMEFFIAQVQVILPVVGFDFLRPKAQPVLGIVSEAPGLQPKTQLDLILSNRHGVEARAVEADGEIIVLAGSRATAKDDFVSNTYGLLRDQLIKDGRLVRTDDPKFLTFAEQVTFPSPSAASAVVLNRNDNGRTSWKIVGSGQTLKDWQDAQLGVGTNEAGG